MSRLAPLDHDYVIEKFYKESLTQQVDILGILSVAQRIMARKPKVLKAVMDLADVVLFSPTDISDELKWLVGYTVSSAVECRYCQAHTATWANVLKAPVEKISAAWNFENDPLFSDAERAALRVARAAGNIPSKVTDEMFDDLKRYYSDDQIIDIVSIISFFGWWNRWNDTFGTELESGPKDFAQTNIGNANAGWDLGRHVARAS